MRYQLTTYGTWDSLIAKQNLKIEQANKLIYKKYLHSLICINMDQNASLKTMIKTMCKLGENDLYSSLCRLTFFS